jgi:hypothetical protein
MRGSKRMSLTGRVGRSGREAVAGLSPLRDWEQGLPTGGLVPFRPGFTSPLEGGKRLCICDVWTASNASTCARHGWAATP